jgi:hypothetical protein
MHMLLRRFSLAFSVAMLLVVGPHAFAKSPESRSNSFQSALERTAATVRAESEQAMAAASRAFENWGTFAEAEACLNARLDSWHETLSAQKGQLDTMVEDATASLEAWRHAAATSLAEFQRSVADALDSFQHWMRMPSLSADNPEIPVLTPKAA